MKAVARAEGAVATAMVEAVMAEVARARAVVGYQDHTRIVRGR